MDLFRQDHLLVIVLDALEIRDLLALICNQWLKKAISRYIVQSTRQVDDGSCVSYHFRGLLHSTDRWALQRNGNRSWWKFGQLHRVGDAALILRDGSRLFYEYGHLHRVNGPALIACGQVRILEYIRPALRDKLLAQFQNLKYLSDRGASFQAWIQHDQFHRVGEAAVICGRSQFWFENGLLHRLGKPAVVGFGQQFWLRGKRQWPSPASETVPGPTRRLWKTLYNK